MTKKFHKVKDNVGELLTYLHGSNFFNVLKYKAQLYLKIGFHHKIYTIYTQNKNSQKFTQFSQLDYGEIIFNTKCQDESF